MCVHMHAFTQQHTQCRLPPWLPRKQHRFSLRGVSKCQRKMPRVMAMMSRARRYVNRATAWHIHVHTQVKVQKSMKKAKNVRKSDSAGSVPKVNKARMVVRGSKVCARVNVVRMDLFSPAYSFCFPFFVIVMFYYAYINSIHVYMCSLYVFNSPLRT